MPNLAARSARGSTWCQATEATGCIRRLRPVRSDFYADATRRIVTHLDAGRNVALLAEGVR